MKFECSMINSDGIKEKWYGKIINYKDGKEILEMCVESRSSLHIIIGKTAFGNFVCIPNYNVGCYLSRFNDLFWNSEKLSELMGEVDGVTAATAIKFIEHELLLWDYF